MAQRYTVQKNERAEILDFLVRRLGVSNRGAKRLLDARVVFVNGERVWMAHHPLRAHDQIEVHDLPETAAARPKDLILYEDEDFVVANKPANVLSNGSDSLESELRTKLRLRSLGAVHRLDRDTSGCLLFAKHDAAREAMISIFRNQEITKVYQVIVAGGVKFASETIDAAIEGKTAITHLKTLRRSQEASLLQVHLGTGRTHQIRKHLAAIRHPVLGDKAYGTGVTLPPMFRSIPRQMLHAEMLSFTSPISGKKITVHAPLPADFRKWLNTLQLQ